MRYLYDSIDSDAIEIDTINFSGPQFKTVDNRLMSLQLIRNGMTEAVMFDPHGNNVLPARVLHKKNILALRGSFRPVTRVNIDMLEKSYEIFTKEENVDENKTEVILKLPSPILGLKERLMKRLYGPCQTPLFTGPYSNDFKL